MKKIILKGIIYLIKLYQKTLSPDHGIYKEKYPFGFCRYYPSCSEYAIQALNKNGILKGGLQSIYRIIRCNPFSKGGVDMVK